jgi:hypothetical protein
MLYLIQTSALPTHINKIFVNMIITKSVLAQISVQTNYLYTSQNIIKLREVVALPTLQ